MRWLCIFLFLFTTLSAQAATVEDYVQQYKNLPCSGITTAMGDIRMKLKMVSSNKEKLEYYNRLFALSKLRKSKRCFGQAYT